MTSPGGDPIADIVARFKASAARASDDRKLEEIEAQVALRDLIDEPTDEEHDGLYGGDAPYDVILDDTGHPITGPSLDDAD